MAGKERTTRTLIALVLATTATLVGLAPAAHGAPVAPTSGILFGTHISPRWGDQGESIRRAESMLGRKFDITHRYHGFTDLFYKPEINWTNEGRVPMASWRATGLTPDANRAAAIARGQYDSTIRSVAREMKKVPGPILVRFAFEMTQAPGRIQYIGTGPEFIAAWRHVVNLFDAEGATNVQWVWDPQAAAFCSGHAQSYYPGDAYVDWIAGTAIPPSESTKSFTDLFNCFYAWGATKTQPLMVQTGVVEVRSQPSWKANWMAGMRSSLKAMPKIKALIYWNSEKATTNYWADTSAGSWNNYKAMACDTYFNPNRRQGC
jgi:beta-mannanase